MNPSEIGTVSQSQGGIAGCEAEHEGQAAEKQDTAGDGACGLLIDRVGEPNDLVSRYTRRSLFHLDTGTPARGRSPHETDIGGQASMTIPTEASALSGVTLLEGLYACPDWQ